MARGGHGHCSGPAALGTTFPDEGIKIMDFTHVQASASI